MDSFHLVINVGSTSIKTSLFDKNLQAIAALNAQYSPATGLDLQSTDRHGRELKSSQPDVYEPKDALAVILAQWQEWQATDGLTVGTVGHRVVHGGDRFTTITKVNDRIMQQISQLDSYAPLHNPLNRLGIAMTAAAFPEVPQFAVFDTAFHRSIPEYAGRYAIPEHLSAQVNFYRYGFHGISCQHSTSTATKILGIAPQQLNLIILHLGGGASATAVRAGISVDTSMGFSPTEGLIMASRSGDLDPMISVTLQRQGLPLEELNKLLNKQSGLVGICGTGDMRNIIEQAGQGDLAAELAIEMFCYRIKKYIGAYNAVVGNLSALIFTGGIGENSALLREKIVDGLEHLGLAIDTELNQSLRCRTHIDISAPTSRAKVLVIHAEEEREIARQINYFLKTGRN